MSMLELEVEVGDGSVLLPIGVMLPHPQDVLQSSDSFLFTQPDGGVPETLTKVLERTVYAEQFGVIAGLSVGDVQAGINSVKLQLALDTVEARGGGTVYLMDQFYVFGSAIKRPNGVFIIGSGVGEWDCVFHNRAKSWKGTNLIFKGAGTKNESIYGITDQRVTGGWRPDTAIVGNTYKLTDFMTDTASGVVRASPRSFSAAISVKQRPSTPSGSTAYHGGMKNLRIVPWMGVDGIEGYSNQTNTALGDEWDIGYLCTDTEYDYLEDVQIVGYWRMGALADIQGGVTNYSSGERNSRVRVKAQGFRGVIQRATDLYPCTASTTSTIEIPYSVNHYWPSNGMIEVPGGGDFVYTGLTQVGDKLTFTGVTPDCSAAFGTVIRSSLRGSGVAGKSYTDCMIHGLNHVSGQNSKALGFSEWSIGFESHGFPLRGVQYYNTKVQMSSNEPCNAFFGNCDDSLMFGVQFETGKVIATPFKDAQSWVAYPCFNTIDMRMFGNVWSANKTLFTPRTYFDDGETFPINGTSSTDDVFATQLGKKRVIKKSAAVELVFQDADGTELLRLTPVSGNLQLSNGRQLTFAGGNGTVNLDADANLQVRAGGNTKLNVYGTSGTVAPGNDNSQSLGSSSQRWSNVYTRNMVLTPLSTVTPANNGDVVFELTGDTQLKVKVKGSDGVIRSTSLTLA